jgi:hypothetical protein
MDPCTGQGKKAHLSHADADKLPFHSQLDEPNIVGKCVPLVHHVERIPSSHLSLEASYLVCGFLMMFLPFQE